MKTDVLILGAGLAGLRAAWGALEAAPDLNVHVVSLRHGPAGSSFANRNNKLGMRVPLTADERTGEVERAMELAAPGFIDRKLVELQYEEAEARFDELLELGLQFQMNGEGVKRVSGCFKGPDTAAIFEDLADAFTKIRTKVAELGARFVTNHEVLGLVSSNDPKVGVQGAWLASLEDGKALCLSARSVVVALGGPASLFERNLAGAGTPGYAHALLQEAGARLENTNYMQYMWSTWNTREFRSPGNLLMAGTQVRTSSGKIIDLTDEPMLSLTNARTTHCPVAFGIDDAALDAWLMEHTDEHASLEVKPLNGGWERIYLAAHAGNGGAVIDGNGYTDVPGLFACGECATGMHGANRLGGAMVTATQVFGRRAGQGAALACKKREMLEEEMFANVCQEEINALPAQDWDDPDYFEEIAQGLQAHALYQPRGDHPTFKTRLQEIADKPISRRVQLVAKGALLVMG